MWKPSRHHSYMLLQLASSSYYTPSTVLEAGNTQAQSLASVACHLAEKTDTETNDYHVGNMVVEVLSKCPGDPEGEPEAAW